MMEIKQVSLRDFTSLKVGGQADMVTVRNEEDVKEVMMHAKAKGLRVHILGSGTNTYFKEYLDNFLVVKNEIKGMSLDIQNTDCILRAGAGEVWDDVVKFAVEKDLWGIENLSYIPGSVGAAPVQNIGAYGSELADVFVSLTAFDVEKNELAELNSEACRFGYRDSLFKQNPGKYIILSITLKLSQKPTPVLTYKPLDVLQGKENITVREIRDFVIATRKAKLPDWNEYPNVGSFFKNPVVSISQGESLREVYTGIPLYESGDGYKIPAAWLIEHVAQMKGIRTGDIGTWPHQPLVIVNYGEAEASELTSFASDITQKVKDKTGIQLEREVNFVE